MVVIWAGDDENGSRRYCHASGGGLELVIF
jgi:hypothetical protein